MGTKKISFQIKVPEYVSDDQLLEWLRWQLGEMGGCSMDNPMVDREIEADQVRIEFAYVD